MPTKIQASSGNVFTDLGFSPEEAQNLKVRSDMMIELAKLIEVDAGGCRDIPWSDPTENQ